MTEKEARKLFYLNKEIEEMKVELESLREGRTYYKAYVLSGMPKGQKKKDPDEYLVRQQELQASLTKTMKRKQKEQSKIDAFLEAVEDSEIRLILRLRIVGNLSWDEIGRVCAMDRRTASRKYYAYFAHNAQ